jgi:hypothetical protein
MAAHCEFEEDLVGDGEDNGFGDMIVSPMFWQWID